MFQVHRDYNDALCIAYKEAVACRIVWENKDSNDDDMFKARRSFLKAETALMDLLRKRAGI